MALSRGEVINWFITFLTEDIMPPKKFFNFLGLVLFDPLEPFSLTPSSKDFPLPLGPEKNKQSKINEN